MNRKFWLLRTLLFALGLPACGGGGSVAHVEDAMVRIKNLFRSANGLSIEGVIAASALVIGLS